MSMPAAAPPLSRATIDELRARRSALDEEESMLRAALASILADLAALAPEQAALDGVLAWLDR